MAEFDKVIKDLNLSYKERNYKIIHYDSPDIRGIDNAFLYDNSRFSVIESRPIKNRLNDGSMTRDILYIKGEYLKSELHIFINHWPSNYGGREKAIPKRASTAKLISKEIVNIMAEDNLAEIILLGDFNENPNEKKTLFILPSAPKSLVSILFSILYSLEVWRLNPDDE